MSQSSNYHHLHLPRFQPVWPAVRFECVSNTYGARCRPVYISLAHSIFIFDTENLGLGLEKGTGE